MKAKKLLLLLGAVVLLFGAYFAVSALTAREQAQETDSVTARTLSGAITQLTVTGSATEPWTLTQDGEHWHWSEDESFPVSNTVVSALTMRLSPLTAESSLSEGLEAWSVYGLDEPLITITAETDAGERVICLIGDTNTHTGEHYMKLDGDDTLYTVANDFVSAFDVDIYALMQFESWPVDTTHTVTDIVRTDAANTDALTLSIGSDADGNNTYTVTAAGVSAAANTVDANELLNVVQNLDFSACADYNADSETLAVYGLDAPAYTVTVTYLEDDISQTAALYVGNGSADGTYYVQMEGSSAIYMVEGSTLSPLLVASAEALTTAQ